MNGPKGANRGNRVEPGGSGVSIQVDQDDPITSDQIRPNPTKSNQEVSKEGGKLSAGRRQRRARRPRSPRHGEVPAQGHSKPINMTWDIPSEVRSRRARRSLVQISHRERFDKSVAQRVFEKFGSR